MICIVALEPGVWLAPWEGDPGRTLKQARAQVFNSTAAADRAITAARTFRAFPAAHHVVVSKRHSISD